MKEAILPIKNKYGFFEIRLESIGGLGANVAGKIIAEAGVMGMGYNGSNFATYGSEKKGTPVSSYIRYCDDCKHLRINSPVTKPNILGVFHENLAARLPITAGVTSDTIVVINTDKSPQEARDYLRLVGGTVVTVDAIKIAYDEKVVMNTIMIGAITRMMEFMDKDAMINSIKQTFSKKTEFQIESNIRGFNAGYQQVELAHFEEDGKFPYIEFEEMKTKWGYKNAPIGGVIVEPGNSILKNNQSSRQGKIPLFHEGRCIHCGMCEMTCPDYCYKFELKEDEKKQKIQMFNLGLDYQFCKGCLRCVDVCPVEALTEELEIDHEIDKLTVKL
ncbi:2-oxoacid:acceptor oxidoreductase family protein [Serpentinicella sp. ANB-PHB4]|uniref:2-oxoacid:acceptor oxidoreductase family protein n=1 Tax=Serpentinicella sp. ANB-PHB4 TaxID=3074076 RepID=UPI002865DE1B|nr:2-oxoacid:acceptor oxidoreductase family protein [Serpentinicella sp. ANB-PHB4]MDR5659236.1 2-oxoacid:acceptor oxidoreductase family protein [Serpentinicella sp. ANB-PHB4]